VVIVVIVVVVVVMARACVRVTSHSHIGDKFLTSMTATSMRNLACSWCLFVAVYDCTCRPSSSLMLPSTTAPSLTWYILFGHRQDHRTTFTHTLIACSM
jgi:hypothetical protein